MTEQNKINTLLDRLDTVQEELWALPENMHAKIDPHDNESIEKGLRFIKEFNENLEAFSRISIRISEIIRQHFGTNLEQGKVVMQSAGPRPDGRMSTALDRSASHFLGESFTHKRPTGFILGEHAYEGLNTWARLYRCLLSVLAKHDPETFSALPEEPRFINRRGHSQFSRTGKHFTRAAKLSHGLFVETNLSAQNILKNIENLLEHFAIPPRNLKLYLREDRDADN